jgi:lipopolysaccharide export system protein LptA
MRTLRIVHTGRIARLAAFGLVPLCAAGFFLTRSGTTARAQGSAPPETVTYESGAAQWLSAPHSLELSQGVQFGQDDATLQTNAAVALLDKDQNLVSAKAQGPVHIYDPQDDLTGQHGSVDFTKHTATLRDNIVLVVKPDKHEANADGNSLHKQFKDPATLTCSEMTYDYKYKIGRIPGSLTVTQVIQTKDDGLQTRTLTADAGLYNGKAQTIQLVGDIKGTYSDGSVIQGDTRPQGKPVLINIKEGAEEIDVPFPTQGHFTVKQQSKSSKDDSPDDDGPDLTLPVPPPHTPGPGEAPAKPQTAPVSAAPANPAPPIKAIPSQTPASPAQIQPTPAQTPPAAAAPAGSP